MTDLKVDWWFNEEKRDKIILEYLLIVCGVLLLAMGINIFLEPHELVTGGATGLGIIFQSVSSDKFGFSVPLWITNLVINAPLLIAAYMVKGGGFIRRTFFATVALSGALFVTAFIPVDYFKTDMLLASVFGGAIGGVGLGIVFAQMATTGGSDLAASLLHHYNKHISVSKFMFVIDSLVIMLGFFIFGPEKAMYAIISVYISSKIIGYIMEGLSFAKAAFIISDNTEAVAKEIMTVLERGATALAGRGLYTGTSKNVILCVVSTKEIVKLKELVINTDKNAFVIVADVREVVGEGFQQV